MLAIAAPKYGIGVRGEKISSGESTEGTKRTVLRNRFFNHRGIHALPGEARIVDILTGTEAPQSDEGSSAQWPPARR